MAEITPAVRQRKAKEVASSEDEDNLFAGTPSEKLRPQAQTEAETTPEPKKKKKSRREVNAEKDGISVWLDVLRVLSFLVVASCGLSYVMSSGESWTWGYKNKPRIMRPEYWKLLWNGPIELTPEELLAYDGTDPEKPIYLAINHTIFDVSSNPRIYGPGGSYNVFAGHDASRGFVTGCFLADRTPDMRGVEEMFLPLDDPETDRHWSYDEMQAKRERERVDALAKVDEALRHWTDFFADSDKYMRVGRVVRPEGWLEAIPRRELCEAAKKGRQRRLLPHEEAEAKERKRLRKEEKKRKKGEAKNKGAAGRP
ncbi:cytochrome b5-like Heme/Steroid binding domain-containing protein [Plectosphaerella plurivora]|uniref:Cytochrome b5-like Heme/Steroid binding domain-containing protein n=1 Tax=Plectosphaerella plurivora TaxID=936078 RepID=A0A9P8VDR2_9PEZI|nr:cytochrome b5-like Heme/Steroid binding domain-containing protein [Plectosphaerella plurivora]